jgi:hypothetical protein
MMVFVGEAPRQRGPTMHKFLAIFNYVGLPSYALPIVAPTLDDAIAIAAAHVTLIKAESIDVIPA